MTITDTLLLSPFPPCFYPLPPLVVSIQWHFSGETNPLRDGQISTVCDIRAALPERGEAAGMNNDGLNKKKKKKTRLCFSLPPPHLFYEKAKTEHVIYVLDVFEHSTTQSVNIYNLHI